MAPYSPRARAGAPVSFPVTADELPRIAPTDFTLRTVPDLLATAPGPGRWADAAAARRQRLPAKLLRD